MKAHGRTTDSGAIFITGTYFTLRMLGLALGEPATSRHRGSGPFTPNPLRHTEAPVHDRRTNCTRSSRYPRDLLSGTRRDIALEMPAK